jgi:hypothetical protein
MVVKGHVEDLSGQVMTSFNGKVYPTIFDKAKIQQTLGQDPDSPIIPFEVQRNIIYKGQATVQNGYFQFEFIVPKDISYSIGRGRISYYANSSMEDAGDVDTAFLVGGISSSGIIDDLGPEIDLTINDDSFVDGGLTDNSPILIAKLFDENGINTVGNGIGHDMTAILDASTSDPFVLNEYYVADVDTYKSGTVNYELNDLSEGEHVLSLKAWDVTNNSSEAQIRFVVSDGGKVTLKHVLNYPNPFTTSTAFFFEHNQPGQALQTQIQIFTVGGRLVKTINEEVVSTGYRSDSIVWDGRDDFGDPLAKGVYIYRISVTNTAGEKEEAIEKLVLLR